MRVEKNGESSYSLSGWRIENLHAQTFWVFDLEGTGGNVATERVTQLGAVKVSGGQVVPGSEFS